MAQTALFTITENQTAKAILLPAEPRLEPVLRSVMPACSILVEQAKTCRSLVASGLESGLCHLLAMCSWASRLNL